jgi:glycosyltransferase involved in cell wall biosynthesis
MIKNKFSVVIVTFNRSRELLFALNSVLKQKFQPSEIIIINNHKNKILKKNFDTNFKKIKIINSNKNLQAANGRNLGVSKSSFNYIAFLDDDDQWNLDYLQKANSIINNNFPDAILTNIYKLNAKNQILKKIKNIIFQDCFVRNPGCMGSNLIVKKKNFLKIGGFNKKFVPAEDREFLIRMLLNKFTICISKSKVFYNENNPTSITKNFSLTLTGHKNLMMKYKRYINFKNMMFIYFKLNKLKFTIEKNYIMKLLYLSITLTYYFIHMFIK